MSAVAFSLVDNQPWFAVRIYIFSYSSSPSYVAVATSVQKNGEI